MERKKAFAAAGAVSATALMGVMAVGANIGLFGLTSRTDGPGEFQIVDASEVVVPDTSPAAGVSGGASEPGGSSLSPTTSKASPSRAASTPGVYAPTSTTGQYESDDDEYEPAEPAEPEEHEEDD